MLALSGDGEGAPLHSAGQIADLGGGALTAAFGILAALRERDFSGEGQFVDIAMADGALAWLAMPAAGLLAGGRAPRRGELVLGGRLLCYRPYRCADGWVAIGALEPKFWAAFCRGVGREDLFEHQFDAPGSRGARRRLGDRVGAARARMGGVQRRARLLRRAGAGARRGARRRAVARARHGRRTGCSGRPSSCRATPGDPRRGPPPGLG